MQESATMSRVRDARASLLLTHPFFGVLSLKLAIEESAAVPTIGVNPKTIVFNPAFIGGLSQAELKGVIAHEVMHLALCHHARQGSKDADIWNQAGDYAINPLLIADGMTLPKGGLIDPQYSDMSAETIYNRLMDKKPEPQQSGGQGNGLGQGDDGQGKPEPNPCGTFESAGPEGSADAIESEREWQENVNDAIRAASSAGKMSASVKRIVGEAVAPKADWRALLRRFMTDQVKSTTTWSKRNKRFPDIYLPGKVREGMGTVVLAVDTSGSINTAMLARFSAEINAICQDVEPAAVHVVYCDAKVNRADEYGEGEEIALTPCGGGGTAFQPVFDHVRESDTRPSCLIYLTDLEGDNPSEPDYPVLWANYGRAGAPAAFGEVIDLN